MSNLSDRDLHEYFCAGNMGFWKMELENGKETRLYADAISDQLFGTSEDMEPEERFRFLIGHIYPDERELFQEYFSGLLKGESEVVYRYVHPQYGVMYVRCTGRTIPSENGVTCIVGYHTRITDVMHLEPEKLLENRLSERNHELIREQMRQNDYYRELMDMASCGIVAYTLPGHRVIHMNAEALRILEMKDISEAQETLGAVLSAVKYTDPASVDKLMRLRSDEGKVDYECMIASLSGKEYNLIARTETFLTPQDERMVVTTFIDVSENVALKNEKSILEALCADYSSVYVCDLQTDMIAPVKAAADEYPPDYLSGLGNNAACYSARVRYYYEHYVIRESAHDFLEKTSIPGLNEHFAHNERLLYRFRTKPDRKGHEHFEMQIVKLNSGDGSRFVLGFRCIDDILHEQERQKEKLENALMQVRSSNEIIGAISKIYWGIYHLDLVSGIYHQVCSDSELYTFTDESGIISEVFQRTNVDIVSPEFQQLVKDFTDVSTLPDRLMDCESISTEVRTNFNVWYLLRYIVKRRDSAGRVTSVLYVVLENSEEKRKELDYQQQLMKSAEEAKRANIAKTDFLRRMSHDIRTPINGIIGMLSIADHFPDDAEKQTECRTKIREASGFLLELINNILDMNKLESGSLILEHKSFDLMEIFSETTNITSMNAQEYGLTVHVDSSGVDHRYLKGSPLHLRQILQNLTGNAVKYNRPGGMIDVSCKELSCSDGRAEFRFICEDNGIGMSEEFQKHAFETFTQESAENQNTYTGTGLGLAITRQLVELMGGTITLESKLGVGSKFTVELTFDIDEKSGSMPAGERQQPLSIGGMRILLAEDNALNMEIARFLLEKEGAVVTPAANGREALDIFAGAEPDSFDLILMDVMMPVMDGLTATRHIRELPREDARSIPIFAMTANAFQDDIQQSQEAGMNAHLSKPLQEDKLYSAISQYVRFKTAK